MISLYVINLERRHKQYESFVRNNKNNSIEINRFNALDGKIENNRQAKIKGIDPVHKQTKHGRFGCFLSHLEVLKLVVQRNNPNEWVIIAEDDAIINKELFNDWIAITSKAMDFNTDIIFLSRTYSKEDILVYPIVNGFNLVKINDVFHGAHLYMVTGIGAQKILEMEEMDPYNSIPYDVALGLASKRTGNIYGIIMHNSNGKYNSTNNFYSDHLMAYAKLSGLMGSSTEEYFENIKEYFHSNKKTGISLTILLILLFLGIVITIIIISR
jgi:GR25 family glycosyltransferase involved in LPS biosynthesis